MKKMRVALALVVSAFTACFTQAEGAAATSLPKATVTQCAPLTLTAAEHDYMVWPSGDDTVDRPLQIVMNFKAQETLEEAKAGAYGKYKCDFYLTIEGLAGDSITADGCYLAGNYGSFGWIVIPTDGTVLEEGVSYPIVSAYDANLTYEDICGSVKDFTAAIYVAPTILADNPDFKVSLALKMTDPNNEANVLTIGTPATYTVKDLLPLPTATVTTVKNDDLTFALNFKADSATEAQLATYGDWYADFVLTVNKDVTFNADGGANGYLAGQYDAWSENWVNVPFEDVTLKANESLKIMAYAAEMMNQGGLKLTYNDVVSFVKDFDCGVFFEPAFLAANPDLNVTLELRMYNPANEAESYVIGETYTFPVPLPTATVTTVKNDDLTFALNFKADEATEAQLDAYGKWYADFVLTVNKEVTFNADGGANGYLAGQYDAWSENWVYVSFEDVTLKANESLKIMAYAAELLGQSGLKLTYNDVYSFVKDFDCGVFFEPAFLAANPDLNVTLELRMYNPANEAESYVIGETYTFNIPTVEVKNEVVTDTMSDKQKEAVAEIVTNTVVTQADTGLLDATAEITAAKEALKNQDGVTAEAVANAMPVIAITVKKVEFIDEEPSKLTFDVTPTLSVGETSVEMNTFAKALTFRLPVPTEWDGLVKVSHAGTLMGTYTIQESEGTKFVELSSASFSEFAIEPIDTALVAKIGETPYATLADAVAAVADNTATTITLIDNVALNETLTIPEGKTVTIDLNGKSISMEESIVTTAYALNNLGTLTLKDSVGTGSVNARGIYNGYGNGGDNVATAKIIVESGTYNAKGTNGGAAIFNYGIAEINGGSFTSIGGYSLNNQAGSSMTIADGVTANNGIYCSNAKVTVNGGNISGNRSGCHVVYAWNSKLTINGGMFYNNNSGNATIMSAGTTECTITGGTFGIKDGRVEGNGNTWTSCLTDTANTATMTVTGGTFNGGFRVQAGTTMTIEGGTFNDVGGSGYGISGTASVKGGTFTDATAKTFASNNMAEGYELIDGTVVKAAPTTVEVGTLAELLAALADNSNGLPIVVTAEIKIPAGATVVLDLNGKTVTSVYQTDSTTKHIYPLNVYGNLTIKDTKDNGSITGRGIFVQVGSKLTIDGGSIYAIDSNGGSALYMYGGDVVINGGHIEQKASGTYNFAINATAGTVTVNGGWVGGNHGAIAASGAAVVINGGTLVCTGTAGLTDNVVYCYSSGTITINGGTFVADNDGPAGGCCVYDANGGATINGGTFGNSSGGDVWGTTGTTIKGGKFENLTEKQHIAPGYELNADGQVVAKPVVAKIGDTPYATLSAAFAAVTDDAQTVTILKDVTENLTGAYLRGNIVTENDAKVTITLTNSDWVYCPYTFVLGANVTLKCPAFFYYAGGTQINGTLIVDAYYQRYAGTKLTINEPGSMTVRGETFILRYTDGDANAGIYINGDNNDETIGLNLAVAYFYQGMINAKDANIKVGTYWQTNETDGQGSANLVLDNSTLTVTVNEHKMMATGNSSVTMTHDSSIVAAGGFESTGTITVDATGFTGPAKTIVKADMSDFTGTIEVTGNPLATCEKTANGLVLDVALSGAGTEADPFVVDSVVALELFRASVNAGETTYNAPGVYVALAADIDMTGINWERGIGDGINATYDGIFDGKGHAIKNVTLAPTADSDKYFCGGLFGYTYGAAVIKNLTIENITVTANGEGHNVGALVGFAYNKDGKLNVSGVTVKNVTITAPNAYGVGAIVGYSYRDMGTIEKCSVDGTTITGYSFVGGITGYSYSNATITDCSVENVTITATSKFVGGIAGIVLDKTTITDCTVAATTTINGTACAGAIIGAISDDGITLTIDNCTASGSLPTIGGNYTNGAAVIAQIGNKYYASFTAAFSAAQAGETITLLKPIVVKAGEELNLNKAVTIAYTSAVPGEDMITNKGTLIVDGASLIYTNTDATASNVTVATISSEPGSVLEIKSGLVQNDSPNNGAKGIYAYTIDLLTNGSMGDVTATISGGKVVSTNYMAIRQFNNGTQCKNTLTITGGEITAAKRAIQIHMDNNAAYTTISGGTITAGEGGYALCFYPTTAEHISVTGGTFTGMIYSGTEEIISGGTFAEEPYAGYIAAGYACTQNDDGTYTVADDPATHFIASLGDLIAFREDVNNGYDYEGVTVYLTADIDMASVDWSVNIGDAADYSFNGTFDGQNHKILNLNSTETAQDPYGYICTGLFGCIAGDASIQNLILENVTINTGSFTGNNVAALVGFAWSCTGTIDNVTVKNVTINATKATGVGAIVGYDYYSPTLTIQDCTVDGTTINGASYVGGVIGYASSKITLDGNTVKNVSISAKGSVGGIAGIMLSGGIALDNTVTNVTLTATGELWANSVGAVAGTMTNGSIMVAGTTVTGGNVADIVGGILVEKPTAPIVKVQAQIGDMYYTTVETALDDAQDGTKVVVMNREAAVAFGEKLVATGDKEGAAAYEVATLLGGSFEKDGDKLVYDYAFGVSNVAYAGNDKFTVTVAIKDADSTVARELTGRTLVLYMVVEGDTPEADVIEDIRIDEDLVFTVAADDQVTFDVLVDLPEAGEGKATYFTVKVTDEE